VSRRPLDPDVLGRLEKLEAEHASFAQRLAVLEARRAPAALSRRDRAYLRRLLPAIAGVRGSEKFLVRDLFEDSAKALRIVLTGRNARRVGRLLRRADAIPLAGFVVLRAGTELHTALWQVRQVPENPSIPPLASRDRVK
jgi:hypothetical protein